jgi:hypothetical protein
MKIEEFFKRLKKEFGISVYDYSRIRPISRITLQKYIDGGPINRKAAERIEKATEGKVSMKDMGFED